MERGERVQLPRAFLKWADVSKAAKVYWAMQALYHQVGLPASVPEAMGTVLGVTRGRIYDYKTELERAARWESWRETEQDGSSLAPADLLTGRILGSLKASVRYTGLAVASCLSPHLEARVGQREIRHAAGISASALRDHQRKLSPILTVQSAQMAAEYRPAATSNHFRFTPSQPLSKCEFQPIYVDRL
jgi:hypothetical protein